MKGASGLFELVRKDLPQEDKIELCACERQEISKECETCSAKPTYQLVGAIVSRIVGGDVVVSHPVCIGIDPGDRHSSYCNQKEQRHR